MQQTNWSGESLIKAKSKYKSNCDECQELIQIDDTYFFNLKGERFKDRVFCEQCGDQLAKHSAKENKQCDKCKGLIQVGEQYFYAFYNEPKKRIVCFDCNGSAKRQDVKDLSTPTQDCHNEDCFNKCSTKAYFCLSCYNKLPPILKDAISLAYDTYRKDKKRYLDVITYAHKECLPFLEKP
jgi:hypothetical protein